METDRIFLGFLPTFSRHGIVQTSLTLLIWLNENVRLWQESDADALYEYASEPEVGERAGWPPHKSREESLQTIRTVFNNPTTWAIVLKENSEVVSATREAGGATEVADDTIGEAVDIIGKVVGAIGYGSSCECALPARENEPTVGYWVGKPYWGMGICTEALLLMIDHIRKTTNIPSLISGHFIDNPASGRVMEKCGFTPTGETVFDNNLHKGNLRPIRVLRLQLL